MRSSRPTQRSGSATTADQLASGSETTPRRWPGRLAVAVVALLVIGYLADGRLRDRELHQLLDRIEATQSTAAYADNKVASIAQYASPQLTSTLVPPGVRRGLERLVEQTAAAQVPAVQHAVSASSVSVLPWHSDVRSARDRFQVYATHRLALLRAGADDIDVLRSPHPDLAAELGLVRAALSAAGASDQQVLAALGSS